MPARCATGLSTVRKNSLSSKSQGLDSGPAEAGNASQRMRKTPMSGDLRPDLQGMMRVHDRRAMKRRFRLSLTRKLTFYLILCSLIPLVAAVVRSYGAARSQEDEHGRRLARQLVEQQSRSVEHSFDELETLLATVGEIPGSTEPAGSGPVNRSPSPEPTGGTG